MGFKLPIASAILALLMPSAATAADLENFAYDSTARRGTAASFGFTISFLHADGNERASALHFRAGARLISNAALAGTPAYSPLVEFDLSGRQSRDVYVGGRRLGAAGSEGGLNAGELFLIVAGVAGAAFVATTIADSNDDDDERCFIEPELCD